MTKNERSSGYKHWWRASTHPKTNKKNKQKNIDVGKIWKSSFLSRKQEASISFRLGVKEERPYRRTYRHTERTNTPTL